MSASSNDQHANKNLPLKKRRTYLTDSPMIIADENENDAQQRVVSKSCTGHEVRAPTPPASPRLELTGQRCTHLLANSTNARPSPCDSFSVEHLLAHHRGSAVQHKSGYATPEGMSSFASRFTTCVPSFRRDHRGALPEIVRKSL